MNASEVRQYNRAFARELAQMSTDEFLHWNPGWTHAQAEGLINQAKTKVKSFKTAN